MPKQLRLLPLGLLLAAGLLGAQESAENGRTPAPEGAQAYFLSPTDGETVSSPVTIRFGLRGIGVAPAGVQLPNTGHHHLLIDVAELPPLNMPLPATDSIRHFGLGQTEVELALPPGRHTLQLLLGDWSHTPHEPPVMSPKITITVAP